MPRKNDTLTYTRKEITKPTKRAAWARSGGLCEAEGERYGLPEGQRCNADLALGVIYDHGIPDAIGGGNQLDDVVCICPKCNRYKTDVTDAPQIAKMRHQRDMARGIKGGNNLSRPMPCGRNSPFKKRMDGTVVRR